MKQASSKKYFSAYKFSVHSKKKNYKLVCTGAHFDDHCYKIQIKKPYWSF